MRRFTRLAVVALAGVPLIWSGGATPAAHAVVGLPAGFSEQVVVSGLTDPTSVEGLPDGRIVVLEKVGRVRIVKNGALVATAALSKSLGACSGGEQGFLGFAVDASFNTNRFVYLYYTRPVTGGCVNRVSRFQFNAGSDTINAASELVLIDNVPGTVTDGGSNHNGGDLEIGPDGFLYVSIGDSGCDPRRNSDCAGLNDAAQDNSILNGKIVRIATNGTSPSDNPYFSHGTSANCRLAGLAASPAVVCREIFANGLRNPYRIAFDTNTSNTRFFINDVGQGAREEIDRGQLGANYGWRCREGRIANPAGTAGCPAASAFVEPVSDYTRTYGSAITGGAFVPNGAWPSTYDGAYLFADGARGAIYLMNSAGAVNYNAPFARELGYVAHMTFLPTADRWALYYTDYGAGALRRIVYNTPAAAPVSNLVLDVITPKRVYDTRSDVGGAGRGLMLGGTSRLVNTQAPAGATAALVNITMVSPRGGGFLTAWQPRTRLNATSIVNSPTAGAAANAAIVRLDGSGNFNIRTSVSTGLVVDVMGYYRAATGASVPTGRMHAVVPTRLVDTRVGASASNSYAVSGDHLVIDVIERAGLPASGVAAVVVSATAYSTSAGGGYLTLYPSSAARPPVSNLNTAPGGDRRSNLAVVPLANDGTIAAFTNNGSAITLDVVGWIGSSSGPAFSGGALTLIAPTRRIDSRTGLGIGALGSAVRTFTVSPSPIPAGRSAVVQNVTIAQPSGAGNVVAYPGDLATSAVTTVAIGGANQVRPTFAITKLAGNGSNTLRYAANVSTHVIVDFFGYYS